MILTTHDMDDIEALCRRVVVIGAGRILVDGPLDALRDRVRVERHLTLDLAEATAAEAEISDPAVRVLDRDGARIRLAFDPRVVTATELISRLTAQHPVRDLFVENPPIEEVIARLYGENGLRDE